MNKYLLSLLVACLLCAMAWAGHTWCTPPQSSHAMPPWAGPPYLYYCHLDYDTFIEIMQAQYFAGEANKTQDEIISLALTVPISRGVDPHIAVCSAYISGTEQGLNTTDAVNKAIEIAVTNNIDQDFATVAAQLGAERYDLTYDNDSIESSSGYTDIDCSSTSTTVSNFDMHLKCRCGLEARPFAAVQWRSKNYINNGVHGLEYVKQIMDYTIFNGGTKDQAICVGYYGGIINLGLYFTSAIQTVVDGAEFACIDEERARSEAERYATEDQPWFTP